MEGWMLSHVPCLPSGTLRSILSCQPTSMFHARAGHWSLSPRHFWESEKMKEK
jgi:hypothetical protein